MSTPFFYRASLRPWIMTAAYALMIWYFACSMCSLLLWLRFVPYRPGLYCWVLSAATVLVCAAQGLYPSDNPPTDYRPPYHADRHACALLMLPLAAFYFTDFSEVAGLGAAILTAIVCLGAVLYFYIRCGNGGYLKSMSAVAFCIIMIFCAILWLQPLFFPTSERVLDEQRYYSSNGHVAVVTQTRVFGQSVRTEVAVRECTPFSLGLGRFEKTYDLTSTTWTSPLTENVTPDIVWDGNVLYVNNEPFFTAS